MQRKMKKLNLRRKKKKNLRLNTKNQKNLIKAKTAKEKRNVKATTAMENIPKITGGSRIVNMASLLRADTAKNTERIGKKTAKNLNKRKRRVNTMKRNLKK